jgi:hypothetical protein
MLLKKKRFLVVVNQLAGFLDHAPTKGKIEAYGIANNGDYLPPHGPKIRSIYFVCTKGYFAYL